jgi:hypothetical protein
MVKERLLLRFSLSVTIVLGFGIYIPYIQKVVNHIWVMNEVETNAISGIIMQTFLRKKLLIYKEVMQTLDQYRDVWQDNEDFCKAVDRFSVVSQRESLDLYLADNILKYTIDFRMFGFRKNNLGFFQQYFRARVLAKRELVK